MKIILESWLLVGIILRMVIVKFHMEWGRLGYGKTGFGTKIDNISETEQDKDIVSIECLYIVTHGLSFDTKIDDLEW